MTAGEKRQGRTWRDLSTMTAAEMVEELHRLIDLLVERIKLAEGEDR